MDDRLLRDSDRFEGLADRTAAISRIRLALLAGAGIVAVALSVTFVGFQIRSERLLEEQLVIQARAFTYEILAVRQFVAVHGGVWVPESQTTTENPYLRDTPGLESRMELSDGRAFVLQNPERVTRRIAAELRTHQAGVSFHLFSDEPVNPANLADAREIEALRLFEGGVEEVYEVESVGDRRRLRFISPVYVTEPCLTCHAYEGYTEGQLRGGISVEVDAEELEEDITRGRWLVGGTLAGALTVLLFLLYLVFTGLFERLLATQRKLEELASVDELTGLDNRRTAIRRLHDELRRADRDGTPLACVMLDLDHFKVVNDTRGHAVGDEVLKATAQGLSAEARAYDTVARIGGEEFLVLMPGVQQDAALQIAERMRAAVLRRTSEALGGGQGVTLSGGVATYASGSGEPADTLLARSDRALYEAKVSGRDRVCTA